MKVKYVPDASARGDFFSDYEILDLERSWNPGGEYFHTRVTSKKKEIECYYEQITLSEREKILKWLDRRTSGKLIFDDRPYAAYFVRPTKKIEFKDYLQSEMGVSLYSGTFTITFTAYNPFAELLWGTIDGHEEYECAIAETGIISSEFMPDAIGTNDTSCLIYNPGTEVGHSIIRFAGKTGSADFEIQNAATGDKCVLKSGLETADGEYYEIHSDTGRVLKVTSESTEIDFSFHDEGYITFEPYTYIDRNVEIKGIEGERQLTYSGELTSDEAAGKQIYAKGKWRYISQIEGDQIEINAPIEIPDGQTATEFNETTIITNMNYISISKSTDAEIERIEMICKAEVR